MYVDVIQQAGLGAVAAAHPNYQGRANAILAPIAHSAGQGQHVNPNGAIAQIMRLAGEANVTAWLRKSELKSVLQDALATSKIATSAANFAVAGPGQSLQAIQLSALEAWKYAGAREGGERDIANAMMHGAALYFLLAHYIAG